MFRFWETVRAERAAPNRAELDLKQIGRQAPDLFIIEHSLGNYRWRLAGTRICELYRRELTGRDCLAGWDCFERDTIGRFLGAVTGTLQPCVLRFRLVTSHSQTIGVEMVGLPLVERSGESVHVFGGLFPFRDIAPLTYDHIVVQEISSARTIWTQHLPGDQLAARLRAVPGQGTFKPFELIPGGR